MIRTMPFNFKGNVEKGRETAEKIFDFLMEQPYVPLGRATGTFASFRADIAESNGVYEIFAELPGIAREDVQITHDEETLTIRAEAKRDESLHFVNRERKTGTLERSFAVDGADWTRTSATLEQGILHVTIPMGDVTKQQERIEIQ